MAYNFNKKENEITKLLPAYIFNYSDDNGKGLFLFIKYLTNYIETANETFDKICSELNVNSSNTYILDILAKKLGVEIPTTITSVEDKQTVLKGKIMTISSTGCAQTLIDTIYGLYPDWHNYDSFGTPIEVGDTLKQLFYNTKETPKLEGLGWDNADETITTTDEDGFETVTKILNVLVSTVGPVVQLVQKESNGLTGYSVIVHYTTEKDDVNVISYKDKYTCDIEDLVDSNNMVTAISPEIDEVKKFSPNSADITVSKYNTYNYPDAKDMYYNSYRTIEYTNNWESHTWQNLPNNISKGDIWQDNDDNIYATREIFQYKLNKQTLTWEDIQFTGLTSFYSNGIWTNGEKMYYSGDIWDNAQSKWEYVNYELTDNYTWIPKTWYGLDTLITDGGGLRGSDIWTDGEKIYCSTQRILSGGTTKYYNYVLNIDTSTWLSQTWEGITNINTGYLFHYKEQILYCDATTNYYTLNIGTNKWTQHTWPDGIDISAKYIWSDGSDYYYLSPYGERYKLNQTSFTWEPITWTGLDDISNPTGQLIWHFDNNVFYGFIKRLATTNSDKVIVDRKRLNNNYQKVFAVSSRNDTTDWKYISNTGNWGAVDSRSGIWSYNNKIYYMDRFIYDTASKVWNNTSWASNIQNFEIEGNDVFNINYDTYLAHMLVSQSPEKNLHAVLYAGNQWVSLSGWPSAIKYGYDVWHTKNNIYYRNSHIWRCNLYINDIWKDINNNIYCKCYLNKSSSYNTRTPNRKFNKLTKQWELIEWKAPEGISETYNVKNIWSDGKSTYITDTAKNISLILKPELNKWEYITITNVPSSFDARYVWRDKEQNTYFSNGDNSKQYKFNKQLLKWEQYTWKGNVEHIVGNGIWKHNGDIYHSSSFDMNQYQKFDEQTKTWTNISWPSGNTIKVLTGAYIWNYNNNTYLTTDKKTYKLKSDFVWEYQFTNENLVSGENIWSDDESTYYSYGSGQYKFIGDNLSIEKIYWVGLSEGNWEERPGGIFTNCPAEFQPQFIREYDSKLYYLEDSKNPKGFIIDEESMSFLSTSFFTGLPEYSSSAYIWTSNNNIFYSKDEQQYIFDKLSNSWVSKKWYVIDNNNIKEEISEMLGADMWCDSEGIVYNTHQTMHRILNSYTDNNLIECLFINNTLSVKLTLKRTYAINPTNPVCLQAPSYALDMIKLPNNLLEWHSPDGIKSPVTIINNVTDKVPSSFEIIREKYQNEWGRYIDKDDDFNPIINYTVSVIDTSSLLQGAQNMHYKVIIGGVDKDGNPGPKLTQAQKDIITEYLIPKFLGVSYEVKFK